MNGVTQLVRPGWVSMPFVSCTYNWDCPAEYYSYLYPAPTPGTDLLGIRAICILHSIGSDKCKIRTHHDLSICTLRDHLAKITDCGGLK